MLKITITKCIFPLIISLLLLSCRTSSHIQATGQVEGYTLKLQRIDHTAKMGKIEGMVYGVADSLPIIGFVTVINGISIPSVDQEGKFEFYLAPNKSYKINFRAIGYKDSKALSIRVKNGEHYVSQVYLGPAGDIIH